MVNATREAAVKLGDGNGGFVRGGGAPFTVNRCFNSVLQVQMDGEGLGVYIGVLGIETILELEMKSRFKQKARWR